MSFDGFDGFVGIDWSGAAQCGYRGIAVARCAPGRDPPRLVEPPQGARSWTRQAVLDWLIAEPGGDARLLVGFDFAFALPGLTSTAFDLWADVDAHCAADADLLGRRWVETDPRFWQRGKQPLDWLDRARRPAELACAAAGLGQPQSPLQLIGAKQVGKGALAGMRLLHRLRAAHAPDVAVWPFDPPAAVAAARMVCVEIYPRLFIREAGFGNAKLRDAATLDRALAHFGSAPCARPRFDDHEGDALVSAAGLRAFAGRADLWRAGEGQGEGWIFGVGS